MSDMDINQVLAQMRVMAAAAQRESVTNVEPGTTGKTDFGELLKDSIDQVNQAQSQAKELVGAFETGDTNVELPEVMVALQKASISFEAMTQVRNKLLNAYQEIMNMQM